MEARQKYGTIPTLIDYLALCFDRVKSRRGLFR